MGSGQPGRCLSVACGPFGADFAWYVPGMPALRLVIFDCDGVLVDSERIAVRVSAAGLTRLGWQMTEEDVLERFVGQSDAFIRGEVSNRLGPGDIRATAPLSEVTRTRSHRRASPLSAQWPWS